MNKNFILKIVDKNTKRNLIHSSIIPFCKQSISVNSNGITDLNNKFINLRDKSYKTLIECSNDKFMCMNDLKIGEKIEVSCMVLFSQVIESNMRRERESAYEYAYVVNKNETVKEIRLNDYDPDLNDLGKIMIYSPKMEMIVTKIEMMNVDMKNKWVLEASE